MSSKIFKKKGTKGFIIGVGAYLVLSMIFDYLKMDKTVGIIIGAVGALLIMAVYNKFYKK
ncbi:MULTISPECIES: hypothetical protein [unclassified Fusibacter]|uniref:hypothetical protein n=1 Tax=unclassified Fusibacter TaxID=2624464 RepID=UPI0010136D9D|nr:MULTISPECIES: hypothetical protein [unclassified Fusibacter]MCK8059096.1 hypothetical protein [Fusibacter sp. A2]NPE22505.1 hypothetical protein [Fusibacter sp. A1]RXV60608.1 hypothetical protein DWB64_11710 [Fusibacter sp. A1]